MLMALATYLRASAESGVLVSSILLYDDACHLLLRSLSVMAVSWEFAAIAALDIVNEKLHYSNHVDPWCVRTLNPHRRPQLQVASNTPVAEQRFRWYNRFKGLIFQKPGGRFRFFLLWLSLQNNIKLINMERFDDKATARAATPSLQQNKYKGWRKRLKKHKRRKKRHMGGALEVPEAFLHLGAIDLTIFRDNFEEPPPSSPGNLSCADHSSTDATARAYRS